MMLDKQKAQLLVEKWDASITKQDRTRDNMPSLFGRLASDLFLSGIEFEVAYEAIKKAAKLAYPAPAIVRTVHNKSPRKKDASLQEFAKEWHDSIDRVAVASFYEYYTLNTIDPSREHLKPVKQSEGMKTEDELNEEDFWKSVKTVSKDKPWLFDDEEKSDG